MRLCHKLWFCKSFFSTYWGILWIVVPSCLHPGVNAYRPERIGQFHISKYPHWPPPSNLENKISSEFLSWETTYFGNIRIFKFSRRINLLFSLSLISHFLLWTPKAKILTSTLAVFYFSSFSLICNKTTKSLSLFPFLSL